jgi:uncharacterized membrane protein
LSLAYSSPTASPLPLALVGLLVALFLFLEARRYRYYDMWRLRARVLENHFFRPILRGEKQLTDGLWSTTLSQDYLQPGFHLSFFEAAGRRLRRNYGWIFLIQVTAYLGKLLIHPDTIVSVDQLWERAAVGPFPGQVVLGGGLIFHAAWMLVAILTWRTRRGALRIVGQPRQRDPMLDLAGRG